MAVLVGCHSIDVETLSLWSAIESFASISKRFQKKRLKTFRVFLPYRSWMIELHDYPVAAS
jgi:hypothetical protein